MSETGMKVIIDAVAWLVVCGVVVNLGFFFANLKLYTEIMKEKSQRDRRPRARHKSGESGKVKLCG